MVDHYHHFIVAVWTDLLSNSLDKVSAWSQGLEFATIGKGKQVAVFDKSTLPWHFLSETGRYPQRFQAILIMTLGVCIVTEQNATRLKLKH